MKAAVGDHYVQYDLAISEGGAALAEDYPISVNTTAVVPINLYGVAHGGADLPTGTYSDQITVTIDL